MRPTAELLAEGPILLYDGSCGVCSEAVQWIFRHERSHALRFAPLEGAVGAELRQHARVPPSVDSLIWAELRGGSVYAETHSGAALRVLAYVGGPWRLLGVLRLVPRGLRDAAYRAFAKVRYRIRAPSCLLPTPAERARFVGSLSAPDRRTAGTSAEAVPERDGST